MEITYPKENEQKGKLLDEGYKWFTNNLTFVKGGMVRNRESMKISEALPQILDQDFSLPYNDKPVKRIVIKIMEETESMVHGQQAE